MRRTHVVLGLVAACTAHDPAIEQKLDTLSTQLAATQRDVAELRRAIEQPAAPASTELDRKIDALQLKIDALATAARNSPPVRPRRAEPDPNKVYAIAVDGFASDGPADARVTMVLAFDYADPYTDKNHDTRVELRKKYGNDLRIVYRNFVVHPQVATATALAGCAANKQHKFAAFDAIAWDKGFRGRNFDKDDTSTDPPQKCWLSSAGCPVMTSFAKEAHLDIARFTRDMKTCESEVAADAAALQKVGVGATPTFFINGRYMAGAMPLENFTALIDEELAKANERIANGAKPASYYKDWVLAKGLTQLTP